MMQAISGGRRTGKTTKLLEMYVKNPDSSVIMVATEQERTRLTKLLVNNYHIPLDQIHIVLPMEDLHQHRQGALYADNIDWILQAIFHREIFTATYTGGSKHLGPTNPDAWAVWNDPNDS